MKIIVTEKISDKGVALLQAVPDFDVDVRFEKEFYEKGYQALLDIIYRG